MPISLVHVVEIQHQHINVFEIKQLTTALIANQIRVVTKPTANTFHEFYDGMLAGFVGRTNREAQEKAVAFGVKENLTVDADKYAYTVPSFDITVTLAGKVEIFLKFLTLEDAKKSYVELLTASSLSQVAQEKSIGDN